MAWRGAVCALSSVGKHRAFRKDNPADRTIGPDLWDQLRSEHCDFESATAACGSILASLASACAPSRSSFRQFNLATAVLNNKSRNELTVFSFARKTLLWPAAAELKAQRISREAICQLAARREVPLVGQIPR